MLIGVLINKDRWEDQRRYLILPSTWGPRLRTDQIRGANSLFGCGWAKGVDTCPSLADGMLLMLCPVHKTCVCVLCKKSR